MFPSKGNIGEIKFFRRHFVFRLLRLIIKGGELLLAKKGVVIDGEFGIERPQFSILRSNEWVNFEQRGIGIDKGFGNSLCNLSAHLWPSPLSIP